MRKLFKKVVDKINSLFTRTRMVIANPAGEGFIDSGVKILIAVVIGALLLGGLYALFNTTIIPTLTSKIQGLFNYSGN